MSFVRISPATKLAAVKLYWQTGNVMQCAHEYAVSRNTIYDWVRFAEQRLENLFLESTPGRRPVPLPEQKEARERLPADNSINAGPSEAGLDKSSRLCHSQMDASAQSRWLFGSGEGRSPTASSVIGEATGARAG